MKAPDLSTKDSDWDDIRARAKAVDTKEKLVTAFFAPGTFEYTHSHDVLRGQPVQPVDVPRRDA